MRIHTFQTRSKQHCYFWVWMFNLWLMIKRLLWQTFSGEKMFLGEWGNNGKWRWAERIVTKLFFCQNEFLIWNFQFSPCAVVSQCRAMTSQNPTCMSFWPLSRDWILLVFFFFLCSYNKELNEVPYFRTIRKKANNNKCSECSRTIWLQVAEVLRTQILH